MKSKRKTPPPQFELPQAEQVFNLASETSTDGERLQSEAEALAAAKLQQEQQQPPLI